MPGLLSTQTLDLMYSALNVPSYATGLVFFGIDSSTQKYVALILSQDNTGRICIAERTTLGQHVDHVGVVRAAVIYLYDCCLLL